MNELNSISETDAGVRPSPGAASSGVAAPGNGRAAVAASSRGLSKRRAILFRLAAVLVGIIPLILLEAGLRFFDVGRPHFSDSLAGFNRNLSLFERQGPIYRTARARQPFFSPQQFPVQKPPARFRIFCFGGSTVYGHPYQSETAFPKWLELELAASVPRRTFEAINCGGISYASYRLAPIVKEVLQYQPDLIVVATGENEFLEDRTYLPIKSRSRLAAWLEDNAYSLRVFNLARNFFRGLQHKPAHGDLGEKGSSTLSREVQPRLDARSGYASYHRDDSWHDRVAAQFEESMRGMVKLCQSASVPIILVKLGANLRDCPPFKSEHRPGLSPEEEAEWQQAFDAGAALTALTSYRQAESIDGEYALLPYRMARLLDRLGQKSEALQYYVKAKDLDVCPLRMPSRHEQILDRISLETKTPLVDAASLLASQSADRIPGNDWYLDHVHPTIGGHQKIAQSIVSQLRELNLVPAAIAWPEAKRRETYARQLEKLGPRYLADGRRRVEWLENWARRERWLDETLPSDAAGFLRLGFRRLDFDDEDGAWKAFGEALKRNAAAIQQIKEHAKELLSEGRPESAASLLEKAGKL